MAIGNIWKTISKISLGLVLVLVWAFMWVRADVLFPVNTEVWRFDYILTFILLISFIFAWDTLRPSRTERDLFRVSFLKRFPVFIFSSIITIVILFVVGTVLAPSSIGTISKALSSVSLGIIFLYAFMIAIGEELIFRGWVPERLQERGVSGASAMWISIVVFALFHSLTGRSYLTLLTYIPLGFIFHQVKRRWSPKTNMANAGAHFGWNLFVLGFLA